MPEPATPKPPPTHPFLSLTTLSKDQTASLGPRPVALLCPQTSPYRRNASGQQAPFLRVFSPLTLSTNSPAQH
jgi:hypothetical protein